MEHPRSCISCIGAELGISDNRIARLYYALWSRLFSRVFIFQFRMLAKNGAWRDATLAAMTIREADRILEVPATTHDSSEPLLAGKPDINYAILNSRIAPSGGNEHISFAGNRLHCNGGRFDKTVCCLALHPLMPPLKLALLRELRRVLRQGGALYIVDFDQPFSKKETLALRGSGTIFGKESADIHHEGTMSKQLELAGFSGIKRVYNERDILGRVSIYRARR